MNAVYALVAKVKRSLMVSLCKVHDTKDIWFLTTYPSKHLSYVRYVQSLNAL